MLSIVGLPLSAPGQREVASRFIPGLLAIISLCVSANSHAVETKPTPAKVTALEITAGDTGTNSTLRLRGGDARRQLLVTAKLADGSLQDFSRRVKYEVKPVGLLAVEAGGFVTPLRDGTATITARSAEGVIGKMTATVEKFRSAEPINFALKASGGTAG